MNNLIRKHWITLVLLFISGVIGIVLYYQQSSTDSWRVKYEYQTMISDRMPDFSNADTLFQFNEAMIRNYTTSDADTLRLKGRIRHEMKIYLDHPSQKSDVETVFDELFLDYYVYRVELRFEETQRSKRIVLSLLLVGFFLGMIIDFVRSMNRQPDSKQ